MSTTSILDLPQIIIHQIYSCIEKDEDRINLFFSCKKLMNKKFLVLNVSYSLESFKYQSIVDCCVNLNVQNNHLRNLFSLLYHSKDTVASTNTTLQYIEPAALSPAAAAAAIKWMEMPTFTLPRLNYLRIFKRNNPPEPYLTSQQIVDFASYIPPCVTTIVFEVDFIEPIATNLPNTLKHIKFSLCYNQRISNKTFPASIESITFGAYFEKEIAPGDLPEGLLSLALGFNFDKPLPKGVLPPNLRVCDFDFSFPAHSIHFPESVRSLRLGQNQRAFEENELPPNLESLIYSRYHSTKASFRYGSLPQSLRKLSLPDSFNTILDIGILPHGLTHLTFADNHNCEILPDSLPRGLTHLKFGKYFNQKLPSQLPNLRELIMGMSFNQKIKYLPETLEYLVFGDDFNQPLPSLPMCLKRLELGRNFAQQINYPPQLELLRYACPCPFDSEEQVLPKTTVAIAVDSHDIENPRPDPTFINDYIMSYDLPISNKSLY
ncbi:hypothetical protein DFA_00503 [Cavenderia fasciculata]|uniref:F-box domain-containing protein n=1 Tax=Cavenderia fasciculata TaxID=261658 RepID=F4PS96_CACFS|nr:uncharacterized protein DFA_00503 [Cavenderia fasciculata]EGG20642.1 hypothetical protein DFA_00503 [Cavenderia fasciculata]|eukprot:XP_004358492.1 hypothetical protein DFA_00503 [Cavenderia fasciculata]